MSRRAMAAAAVGLALAAPGALAQVNRAPIACGTEYVIQRGDTLQRVARRAYGPDASYRVLWDFNRDRMATRDPSLIEVGDVVQVPCLGEDGAPLPMPGAGAAATAAEPAAAVSDAPAENVGMDAPSEIVDTQPLTESVTAAAPADDAVAVAPEDTPDTEAAPAADAAAQADAGTPDRASPAIDAPSAPNEVAAAALPAEPSDPDAAAADADAPVVAEEQVAAPATAATSSPPELDAKGADEVVAADTPPAEPPAAVGVAAAPPPPAGTALQSAPEAEPEPARIGVIGGGAAALTLARAALTEALGDAAPALFADAAQDGDAAPAVLLALTAPECAAANLCDTALWSDPIMDAAVAVHAPAALAPPLALTGLRVCLGGAEAAGLRAMAGPGAYVGADAAACLADVAAQRAGAAVTLASSADAALREDATLRAGAAEVFALAAAAPLHASAPRDDPAAAAIIAALNDGLAALRDRGDWFAVLQAHLSGTAAP